MKRWLKILATGIFLSLPCASAWAQQVNMYWQTGTGPSGWQPVTSTNPLPVNTSPAFSNVTPVSPGQYTPVSDSAATSLTIPAGATYAVVCVEGSQHRFTWDGTTTPTASVGSLMAQGPSSCMALTGSAVLAAFKIIAVSAGGTFTVSYGK